MNARRYAPCLLAILLHGVAALPVAAHSFEPAVLAIVERTDGRFDVGWTPPSRASGFLFYEDTLQPRFPPHCQRREERLVPTEETDIHLWRIDCGATGLRGTQIGIAGFAGSQVDVVLRLRWLDGSEDSAVLRRDTDTLLVAASAQGDRAATLARYAALGVEHILLGFDHLAFVLGLFALSRRRQLVATITGFTFGHSITLSLATLHIVTLPQAYCEAVIALSIAFLGRSLVGRRRRGGDDLTTRFPWLMATLFGLLHGLGFAAALGEIGFASRYRILALIGFNLGVEVGQLLFVAALTLLAEATRRVVPAPRPALRRATGYLLGIFGFVWLIDRVTAFGG